MPLTRPTVEQTSSNQVDVDKVANWPNSAPANTEVQVDFAQPARDPRGPNTIPRKHRLQLHNPSGVTPLTIKVYNRVNLGGIVRDVLLATVNVPVGVSQESLIEGMFGGTDGVRLVLSNDTALGAADTFTADLAIREA